ncbi:MAG TPA: hemerythrin domain-containing protein [Mycobacteriales bacterium]|jgi:hemerythrin superfamily protein|nr:hemerythrin domain-containing protein [Mycobacteriales bacterium]
MTKIEINTAATKGDVVAQLLAQHDLVRKAIDDVAKTKTPTARQNAFDTLRELLSRHETAEEMIVRPLTRGIDGGAAVASARMNEENESKDVLAKLEKMDIVSVEFARTFETFAKSVLEHAQAEEAYEFPLLRSMLDAGKLEQAETALLMAEKTAPTHPHPSARSTTMNYLTGPVAALADRAKDAVSRVRSS